MSNNTKFVKGLLSKLDADLYNLEEESLLKIEELEALLKEIFSDITKDNRLSPDTFDKLIEVVKNG